MPKCAASVVIFLTESRALDVYRATSVVFGGVNQSLKKEMMENGGDFMRKVRYVQEFKAFEVYRSEGKVEGQVEMEAV